MNTSLSPQTYKPKENHPWRQYKNKLGEPKVAEDAPILPAVSIKSFLSELVTNYDDFKIPNLDDLGGMVKLKNLRDDKVAIWLIDFLKRNWLAVHKPDLLMEEFDGRVSC